MKSKTWKFFISFFLFQISLLYFSLSKQKGESDWGYILHHLCVTLFFFIMIFLFVSLLRETIKDAKAEAELITLEQQNYLRETQIKAIKERKEQTELFQNDIRKKLELLQKYLESESYEEAESYFKTISKDFEEIHFHPCCSDSLLNAILDHKRLIAQEHHIQVNYNILLPESDHIVSASLSGIFFNLLDNAIEACIASDNDSPCIYLSTKYVNHYLTIHMKNSKNASIPFSHRTSKKDRHSHGFGLSIIEEIVENSEGTYEWLDHRDVFESKILISYEKGVQL